MSNNTTDTVLYKRIFELPIQNFKNHIENPNNKRILFSGQYGMGKTTFLKHFFETNEQNYNVFHLFPVNYSVLDNTDIFTYIKYDILFEILHRQMVQFPHYESNTVRDVHNYVYYNFNKILGLMILAIPKIGRHYFQLHQELIKTKADFEEFKRQEKGEELAAIEDFFKDVLENEGELYENNFITQIIIDALVNIKKKADGEVEKKENVLILDDLDRIDPRHIFRLLNVFAAHFDRRDKDTEMDNKFGFDKVVFVGDIDNIRAIYQHYYGEQAEFNGYIDKFYNEQPFKFDNSLHIEAVIKEIVSELSFTINNSPLDKSSTSLFKQDIEMILTDIFKSGGVNMRVLLKFNEIKISAPALRYKNNTFEYSELLYLGILNVLLAYFDDLNYLKNILRKTIEHNKRRTRYSKKILLVLAEIKTHEFRINQHEEKYTLKSYNIGYTLSEKISHYDSYYLAEIDYRDNDKIVFYPMLVETIELLEELKYF